MKKNYCRLSALCLALCLMFLMIPPPARAAHQLPTNIRGYVCGVHDLSTKRLFVWKNPELTDRNEKEWIDAPTDEVILGEIYPQYQSITVNYPTASGARKTRFIPLLAVFPDTSLENVQVIKCSKRTTTFRAMDLHTSYGYTDAGDTAYLFETPHKNGTAYRIIYPLTGGGFKIAYISSNDLKNNFHVISETGHQEQYISSEELLNTANEYSIDPQSNAYQALLSINSTYASQLDDTDKSGTVVFFFEGVGSNSSASKRMNAMCVVVKNHDIVYLNRNSSTLPDYPFHAQKNGGTAMPTIKSGVYNFKTVNHRGKYAALNVVDAAVVRFSSQSSFWDSTSTAINVHRRDSNDIVSFSKNWVNSAGCLLVGQSGTGSSGEYAKFIQMVGIVSPGASGSSIYQTSVSGKIILDRTYADEYLSSVGYPDSAITALK